MTDFDFTIEEYIGPNDRVNEVPETKSFQGQEDKE